MLRLFAVALGFFLADMVLLFFRAPGLLSPANWTGALNLLGTGILLYAVYFLMMLGFLVMLTAGNFILRLKFDMNSLAILTVILTPFYIYIQDRILISVLGIYINPADPYFYVPVLIAMAVLLIFLALVRLVLSRVPFNLTALHRAFSWPGLTGTAFAMFMIYALIWGPRMNVLSLFDADQQRAPEMEYSVEAPGRAADEAPNFIVVKIEAFRRDEFTRQNVPFLWQLAQDNTWFSNYHVVASATRPSVTSFFTSLYPAQHGCYNLAVGKSDNGDQTTVKVSEAINCLPRILQENGYRTEMFTSNTLATDPVFGFQKVLRRFSSVAPYEFKIPAPESFVGYSFLRRRLNMFRIFNIFAFSPEHSPSYFDAPRLNTAIQQSLKQSTDSPVMMYIHYMEPHMPYYHHPYVPLQIINYSATRKDEVQSAYREELSAIDRSIAGLFELFDENGILDNSWILITADHGEEFLDHKKWGHGKSVFPEILCVPAILVEPVSQRKSQVIDSVVESIDIMPTFADIADIPVDEYWEGESLVPLISGTDTTGTNLALAQFDDKKQLWSSAISGNWQVIFREPSGAEELDHSDRLAKRKVMLFDLAEDPLAQNDLSETKSDKATEMTTLLEGELARFEISAPLFRGEEQKIDPEQMKQLRALGYVD
ncbi:sulfatase-like hydrolase/transferase [bacterium]|nr:sulfatase-like hydrolase/transferase [bacterium]MBU1072197.1 sulfatase-like hydrolase/transferase [bacterium]MBU1675857.1 sulfatase-like hydrolase/transferase [bacterium]